VAARRVSRRVGGKKRPSLSGILAALCAVGLAIVVARAGAVYVPGSASHLRSVWDFSIDSTPSWISPNALVTRAPDGLVLTPRGEPAGVSSGPVALDTGAQGRLRLRLAAGEPSEGRVGLLVRTPSGSQTVRRTFQVRGGVREEIIVPVGLDGPARASIQEVMLVPSVTLQPVTISSIRFESDAGYVWPLLKEVVSALPGDSAARDSFTMNTLAPPLFGDRSVWAILIPIILLAATTGTLLRESDTRLGGATRRWAWGLVVAVWIFGFGVGVYHQVGALRVDVSRFGGVSRAEAYAAIDHVPLWDDMQHVARLISPRRDVEVFIDYDRPDVQLMWKERARYYLYPIIVRDASPVMVRYFGQAHTPCAQVESDRTLLHEAERFCLFQVKK